MRVLNFKSLRINKRFRAFFCFPYVFRKRRCTVLFWTLPACSATDTDFVTDYGMHCARFVVPRPWTGMGHSGIIAPVHGDSPSYSRDVRTASFESNPSSGNIIYRAGHLYWAKCLKKKFVLVRVVCNSDHSQDPHRYNWTVIQHLSPTHHNTRFHISE